MFGDPIPEWLGERLLTTEQQYVQYESSFEGPHNALLFSLFPPQEGFLVKPKGRLRAQASLSASSSSSSVSTDSTSQPVQRGSDNVFPDFLICRATAAPHGDRPFLIWELKRGDSRTAGEDQVERYKIWVENYRVWIEEEEGQRIKNVLRRLICNTDVDPLPPINISRRMCTRGKTFPGPCPLSLHTVPDTTSPQPAWEKICLRNNFFGIC